jgi:hypothetical protein
MKYALYTIIGLLCICIHAEAQSFKYESVAVKYRMPAKTPFTAPFQTISVRFHGEEYLKPYGILASDLAGGDFKYHRYQNVPEQGDLHLDVVIGKPEFLGVEPESETQKKDEKVYTYHFYRGAVITPMSYTLYDGARNVIEEKIMFSASDHLYFTTERFGTVTLLEKDWKVSQNITITKMMKIILEKSLTKTAMELRDRFDDLVVEDNVLLFNVNKADKVNAEFMNTAFDQITAGIAKDPVITDWDEARKTKITDLLMRGTKFDADDKDLRTVYAVAHYDLAALNIFWSNPDAAQKHLFEGAKADKKNYEFNQLKKLLEPLQERGRPDALAKGEYVSSYKEGADSKLPPLNTGEAAPTMTLDFSSKANFAVDTVYVQNGDVIIGYVSVIHKMRNIGSDQIHDFTHLEIQPINMPQENVIVPWDEILYLRHKELYMKPLVTKIVGSMNPPVHLYEPLKISDDQRLVLMRSAYHESMPYTLKHTGEQVYLYTYKTEGADEYDFLPVSAGARYVLSLNNALAKDFESCPAIVRKAGDKHYKLEEALLIELVDDYNSCD